MAVRTPLIPFTGQAKAASTLLIKPESLQPTGAFKLRGAYNAVYAVTRGLNSCALPAGVVAHSSGNHGFAVAYAARLLGISAAIVVPENAPAVKTDAIASTGAELVRVEPTLAARIAATEEIARVRGYHPVAPFDDRDVIAGQGTIGLEIAEDFTTGPLQGAKPPAAVLVPIGGGGLISGLAVAVKALLPGTRVIGVEPSLPPTHAPRRGHPRALDVRADLAHEGDALRVEQVGELTFPHIQAYVDDIATVSEDEVGWPRSACLPRQARLIGLELGGALSTVMRSAASAAELGITSGHGGPRHTGSPRYSPAGRSTWLCWPEFSASQSYTGSVLKKEGLGRASLPTHPPAS